MVQGHQIFRSVVAKGDTAGVILNEWLSAGDVMSLIKASDPVFSLATIREGRPFSVERDAQSGDFIRFVYEMDNTQRLVVDRRDASFVAVAEPIEYDTELVKVRGHHQHQFVRSRGRHGRRAGAGRKSGRCVFV